MTSPTPSTRRPAWRLVPVALLLLASTRSASPGEPPPPFLKNQGQWPADILYQGTAGGVRVRFLRQGLSYAVGREHADANEPPEGREYLVFNLQLRNALPGVQVEGVGEERSTTHFLLGNDPARWVFKTPQAKRVSYRGVYPGIDATWYAVGADLKYDFVLQPGARIEHIDLSFAGIEGLRVLPTGELEVSTAWGPYVEKAPYAYQLHGDERREVPVRYVLRDPYRFGFEIAGSGYDPGRDLVIDPLSLVWSTFLRSSTTGDGYCYAGAADVAGNGYLTGYFNTGLTTTPGVFQPTSAGGNDVFVSKISADGTTAVYTTYIGGTGDDRGYAIAVNLAGEAFVGGRTSSANFPVTAGVLQPTYGGSQDAFVTRLNRDGTGLVYSTFLGGSGSGEQASALALNQADEAFVAGVAGTGTFPTTPGAFQRTTQGGTDAFAARVNATGTALVYATLLGGTGADSALALAVNGNDQAIVCGNTASPGVPTTPGAYQRTAGGGTDAFVTRLDAGGTALVYSTLLGGTGAEVCGGIAVNALGEAFVTGTAATGFPVTAGALQTVLGGSSDAFVTRLDATGSTLVYSTFLGGSGVDAGFGILVNAFDEAYVGGQTTSPNFPTTPGAFQTVRGGSQDLFASHITSAGDSFACGGSTYFGGLSSDYTIPRLSWAGTDVLLTATTHSTNFPIQDRFGVSGSMAAVYQATHPNNGDDIPVAVRLFNCTAPLSVHWDTYRASCQAAPAHGVLLEWRTLDEDDTSGFNVERSSGPSGPFAATDAWIAAVGPGAPYAWLDGDGAGCAGAPATPSWYRIVEYTSDGRGSVTPPFPAEPAAGAVPFGASTGLRTRGTPVRAETR